MFSRPRPHQVREWTGGQGSEPIKQTAEIFALFLVIGFIVALAQFFQDVLGALAFGGVRNADLFTIVSRPARRTPKWVALLGVLSVAFSLQLVEPFCEVTGNFRQGICCHFLITCRPALIATLKRIFSLSLGAPNIFQRVRIDPAFQGVLALDSGAQTLFAGELLNQPSQPGLSLGK